MNPVSSAFARFPRRCSSVRAVSGSHRSSTSRRTAAAGAGASVDAMSVRAGSGGRRAPVIRSSMYSDGTCTASAN